MNQNDLYKFNILYDEAVCEDILEDSTHENIAEMLFNLVLGSEQGLNIGLEGSWGAGKSSIVSILSEKLKKKDDVCYFYFDAWAHEGDPLRRIFLDSLVESIRYNNQALSVSANDSLGFIQSRINNKIKSIKTKSKSGATALGKCFAFATLLVPAGAAILSNINYSDLGLSGTPNVWFLLGLLFSFAPIIIIVKHIWYLKKKKIELSRVISDPTLWPILSSDTTSTTTQEYSEEDEKSSIEFERFFGEIVEIILNDKFSKILIIIDNLDRIKPDDALTIWSTLQTFLQKRNPVQNTNSSYKQVYTIVPYDKDGLIKLWVQDSSESDDAESKEVFKSFLDKYFNVRIAVPKPLFSNWQSYLKKQLAKCCSEWPPNEIEDIKNILQMIIGAKKEPPSLREIKMYINHIAVIRNLCEKSVSTSSIAYYVYYKYLKQGDAISAEKLLTGNFPFHSHKVFLPESIVSDLSALLYGVSPQRGQEILLTDQVATSIEQEDAELLLETVKNHPHIFWIVFNNICFDDGITDFGKAAYVLTSAFANIEIPELNLFTQHIIKLIASKEYSFTPDESKVRYHVAIVRFMENDESLHGDISKLYDAIIKELAQKIKNNETKEQLLIDYVIGFRDNIIKYKITSYNFGSLVLKNWLEIAKMNYNDNLRLHSHIKPRKENILKDLNAVIFEKNADYYDFSLAVRYFSQTGFVGYEPFIKNLIEFLRKSPQDSDVSLLNIVSHVYFSSEKCKIVVKENINNGLLLHCCYFALEYADESFFDNVFLALIGHAHYEDFFDFNLISTMEHSDQMLEKIRNLWKEENDERAKEIIDILEEHNESYMIFDMADKIKSDLMKGIMNKVFEASSDQVFHEGTEIRELSIALDYANDKYSSNFILDIFDKETEVFESISEEYILEYSEVTIEMVRYAGNSKFSENVRTLLENLTQEKWEKSLQRNDYIIDLANELKKINSDFNLSNNYTEALTAYIKTILSGDKDFSEWHENNFSLFSNVLDTVFHNYAASNVTECIMRNLSILKLKKVKVIHYFIDFGLLITSAEFKGYVISSIINKNLENLKIVEYLFTNSQNSIFDFKSDEKTLVRQPLFELYENASDSDQLILKTIYNSLKMRHTRRKDSSKTSDENENEE